MSRAGRTDDGRREWLRRAAAWSAMCSAGIGGASTLSGCGAAAALVAPPPKAPAAPPPPPPTIVSGTLRAAATLNPSVSQRPSPLKLRIYELKSDAAFRAADFMTLYQSDQTALGADLVSREELTIEPGEQRAYARTLARETRHLGFVAAYRDLERATWRTSVDVGTAPTQRLSVTLERLAVSATLALA